VNSVTREEEEKEEEEEHGIRFSVVYMDRKEYGTMSLIPSFRLCIVSGPF
jgi:hypothetical protein